MRTLLAFCLLLFSSFSWAVVSSCSNIHGQNDLHALFTITAQETRQDLTIDQTGKAPDVLLFSTVSGSGALLVDSFLYSSTAIQYDALITYDSSDGDVINYYRKVSGTTDWGEAQLTASYDFKPGKLILSSSDSSIVITHCDDSIPVTEPPIDTNILSIEPIKEVALLCDVPQFTFTVRNSETGNIVTDYSEAITVTLPAGLSASLVKGGMSGSGYTTVDGELILAVNSSEYGQFTLSGTLENGESDSSELYVVPYKFDINAVNAIAGRNTNFDIVVQACKAGNPAIVPDYSGDKSLIFSELTLETPTLAQGAIKGSLLINAHPDSESSIDFSFSDGNASGTVNYDESGVISFKLADSNFSCPSGFDCEGVDDDDWNGLEGIVNVNVRPWTFAICAPDGDDMDGTSMTGDGFKAAGETFSLTVKPIIYQFGAAVTGEINVTNYCSAQVTENFFLNDAPATIVYLKGTLSTPSGGNLGTGADLVSIDSDGNPVGETKYHYQKTDDGSNYDFSDLYWNEVGSLKVTADIGITDYLGMTINTGYRNVGRFYPDHLSVLDSIDSEKEIWDYAQGHDGFAYMSQPFTHQFTVQAESSRTTWDELGLEQPIVTTNYGLFSDELIVTIDYLAMAQTGTDDAWEAIDSGSNQRIKNGETYLWQGSDWDNSSGQLNVVTTDFELIKRQDELQTNYTTVIDGPFGESTQIKAKFGLLVTDKVDSVDLSSLDFGSELSENVSNIAAMFDDQPEFRYGRMSLSDVGGNQDAVISVPLKVEYWNGSAFELNIDDSASGFNVGYYCREQVWRNDAGSSDAAVSISDSSDSKVTDGLFNSLVATHSEGREQVRLWLRQQSVIPDGVDSDDCFSAGTSIDQPWLRYNWRNTGDEDPSAVLTFGIYRGNDRVIFRGENRLTGQ